MLSHNVYYYRIFEPLVALVENEFTGIPVELNKHTGHQSFLVKQVPEELIDLRTRSQARSYQVEVVYDYEAGETLNQEIKLTLSNIAEQFVRLIDEHSDFTIHKYWVDEMGTWSSTTSIWSQNRDTYCWHFGRVSGIDYEQAEDVEKGHYQVKMIFECYRENLRNEKIQIKG